MNVRHGGNRVKQAALILGALVVLAVYVWQAITANGSPNSTVESFSPAPMVFSTAA